METKTYRATGTDRFGKKFSINCLNISILNCINIFKGSYWEILENGKKKLLKRF